MKINNANQYPSYKLMPNKHTQILFLLRDKKYKLTMNRTKIKRRVGLRPQF